MSGRKIAAQANLSLTVFLTTKKEVSEITLILPFLLL